MQKGKFFKNIRSLTLAAMLTAVSVVIGIVCKNFMNFGSGLFRVTFENLPIILYRKGSASRRNEPQGGSLHKKSDKSNR